LLFKSYKICAKLNYNIYLGVAIFSALLIDHSAVFPYLSIGARERINVTHSYHGTHKVPEEKGLIRAVKLY